MLEQHIILNVRTNDKKGRGVAKAIKKKVGEEDAVVGHKTYANPARSLDMAYHPGNTVSGSKHSTKLIVALLDKVSKSSILRGNKCSKGNLLLLNGSKDVLDVSIVKRGWLRGRTRSYLTRRRGWMIGCSSNNLFIIRYPIKVSSMK